MSEARKVAFVTGGSRGIGLAIVKELKNHGYAVAVCARTEKSLANVSADLKLACDVSNPKDVRKALSVLKQRYPKIDLLVNNAGIAGGNEMHPNVSDELWDQIIATNLSGPYYVTKTLLDCLVDGGRIINIGSVLSFKGVPDQVAYCSAKHGILGFTRALASDLARRKITVNAVCPGWVRTDMAHQRLAELQLSDQAVVKSVPLKRFIEPAEVASAVIYLASDAAAMITGQVITIDGGSLL